MQLKVDIADNPASLAKGLMGVKKLDNDAGMLFSFPSIIEASFWGKDTYIPLDIAFIDADNTIVDIQNITPMSTRSIRSNKPCLMAVETNAGFFKKNEICVGDNVIVQAEENNKALIIFAK